MSRSASITQSIISTINSGIGCAFRNNTVGVYDAKTKRYRRSKDRSAVGTADVVACVAGKYYEIEVKAGRDRQSDDQKEHQQKVTKAGGTYIVIRTTDEFLTYAESFGWLKNGIRRTSFGKIGVRV